MSIIRTNSGIPLAVDNLPAAVSTVFSPVPPVGPGVLLTDFTSKLPTTTEGTMTINEASSAQFVSGTQSWHMKLVDATDNLGQARFNEPLDLSSVNFISVWIYDESGNFTNDAGSDLRVNFFGQTDSFATTTNKFKWANTNAAWPDSPTFGGKWKCVRFRVDSPIVVPADSSTLAQIQWWMIEIDNFGAFDVEVYIDSIYLDQTTKSKLVLMFDDGSDSDFTEAYDYMYTQNGMQGTSFINSDTMIAGTSLTLPQAQQMFGSGWTIGPHGKDHTNLTLTSVPVAVQNVDVGRDYLNANGMPTMSSYMAFPFNATNSALNDGLQAAGYKLGRIAAKSATNFPQYIGHPDNPAIKAFDSINFPLVTSVTENSYQAGAGNGANDKALILEAARQGASIFILMHRILASGGGSPSINRDSFQEFIDWILSREAAGYFDTMSLQEFFGVP